MEKLLGKESAKAAREQTSKKLEPMKKALIDINNDDVDFNSRTVTTSNFFIVVGESRLTNDFYSSIHIWIDSKYPVKRMIGTGTGSTRLKAFQVARKNAQELKQLLIEIKL